MNTRMKTPIARLLAVAALMFCAVTAVDAQVMEVEKRAKEERAAEEARKAEQRKAEQAAEEARKAAEAAAAARKEAGVDLSPIIGEDAAKLMEQQEKAKQAAREKQARKAGLLVTDSVKWAANQKKLREWKTKWFVGGQLDLNMMVADNITDHPPFKYGETFGMGFDVFVGRHIARNLSLRAGVSFQNAKNRVDWEIVETGWQTKMVPVVGADGRHATDGEGNEVMQHLYDGKGFYRFSITEFYVDAVCDVSGSHKSNRFRPLHVNAIVGVGLMAVGEKKLLGTMKTPQEIGEEVTYNEKGQPYVAGMPTFEGLVKTKTTISPALRLGLLFDYRVAKNVSVNVEPLITVGNDNVDGIKYAEPFDFLVNIKGGLTYHF